MRILHTSDWHLGRQFHNQSMLEDQRIVLDQIVDIAVTEQVDVVLIAGDLYDRSVPPAAAVSLLSEVLDKLIREHGIPVIAIAGNHDSAERLDFASGQMADAGLHICGAPSVDSKPVILSDQHGEVAFWLLPYADPASVRVLFEKEVKSCDQAMQICCDRLREQFTTGQRNVLLSHCFVLGGEASESERPLSLGGAEEVSWQHFDGFDYVALGHLHGRQWRGRDSVRYSGSILKYSFSEERQIKSVVLIDMAADGQCQIDYRPLAPRRDMRTVEGELQQLLEAAAADSHSDDYLQVRLTDRHAILDALGKLRDKYPNVLHLERPGLMQQGAPRSSKQTLAQSELSMFSDFYQQLKGEPLSHEQRGYLENLLDDLARELR